MNYSRFGYGSYYEYYTRLDYEHAAFNGSEEENIEDISELFDHEDSEIESELDFSKIPNLHLQIFWVFH